MPQVYLLNVVSDNMYENILLFLLLVVVVLALFVAVVLYRAFRTVLKLTNPEVIAQEEKAKKQAKATGTTSWKSLWNKFIGLRPIEQEKDILMDDHEYDGIQELDNPIPLWFNLLFYGTIVFSVIYLLTYHVFGWGMLQHQEYESEMAKAEKQREEYLAQSANNIDENTVVLDLEPQTLEAGKVIFAQNCAACHGELGEGGIGPNLTDDYWIHGGGVKDIFSVIKYGVLDKGMIAWEQSLTPSQIAEVSNFIVSIHGTNPPNAKDAEGEKYTPSASDSESDSPEEAVEESSI